MALLEWIIITPFPYCQMSKGVITLLLPPDQAFDNSGNGNTLSNTLILNYIIIPGMELTCPGDIVVDALPGATGALINWENPGASTTCQNNNITIAQYTLPLNGDEFPLGTTLVGYEAVDSCFVDSCTFNVIVNVVPSIVTVDSCPADTFELIQEGTGGANHVMDITNR